MKTKNMIDDDNTESNGLDRRQLIKRGALITGAAWAAPMVLDSFMTPASAATAPFTSTTPGEESVAIPAGRAVDFTLIGGGGAGGWFQAFNGGPAMKIDGHIPANPTTYTATVTVAQGGQAAATIRAVATGGTGYTAGGSSGDGIGNSGGSGGGSSAIISTSPAVRVVAPGGAGSGGGGDADGRVGGACPLPSSGPVTSTGSAGTDGGDPPKTKELGDFRGLHGNGATANAGGSGGLKNGSGIIGEAGTGTEGGNGGSAANNASGAGGAGSAGVFGGGGGSGGTYAGAGAGGTGSAVADGTSGTGGTGSAQASPADTTSGSAGTTKTATPNTPGAGGKGGYSVTSGFQNGSRGQNGSVVLTLLP